MQRLFWCVSVLVAGVAGCLPEAFRSDDRSSGKLRLSGHVEVRQVHVSFSVAELVEEVLVDEGDAVEPGAVLARLRREPYEYAVREAEAALQVGGRPAKVHVAFGAPPSAKPSAPGRCAADVRMKSWS